MTEDCLLCGARQPIGHVSVRTELRRFAGRICSSHTFRDVILDRSDRFFVEITLNDRLGEEEEPVEVTA